MRNSVAVPSRGPIIAFLVILLLGILIAAFLFRDLFQKNLQKDNLADTDETPAETTDTTPTPTEVMPTETTPTEPTTPETTMPTPDPNGYATDSVLVTDLTTALESGDLAKFVELAGQSALPEGTVTRLRQLVVDQKFTVDKAQPFTELTSADGKKVWAINLNPPSNLTAVGKQQIKLSLTNDPTAGWTVANVAAPDVKAMLDKMKADKEGVPLKLAGDFLKAVVARDFKTAKGMVQSDKLSDEKLAALFIVVEEGTYKEKADKPLVPTVIHDDSAWVIARLQSPSNTSEFGIEMETVATDWKIVGLNFDQMMNTVAMEAGAGDIAYAPLVTDMRSGDSLVLFFEFDADSVNARAAKQLDIIATILKEDPKRVLHINGHADAKGDENYNEALSESRAASVRSALVNLGVPANQIQTSAFGESAPKAPNLNPDGTDNPNGRAQNRRAEVYLQF